ncbi:hypothetical protein [Laceyella putida]|uniref:Uncharacterized protein n=1 Tax=Laceyella putida TaxID=110101 RepID=A0ABW2RHW3_9BACL
MWRWQFSKRGKKIDGDYVSEDGEVNAYLVDPEENEKEYYEMTISVREVYPPSWCAAQEKAIMAIKYSDDKGTLSKDHAWEYI